MRNRLFAAILAFVFGSIGLNEYYLGNTATGIIETILSILFCWTFIIPWAIYLVNVFRGMQYLWCNSDEEMVKLYGPKGESGLM